MQTIILGIDPGLLNTGWAVIKASGNKLDFVSCGTIKTKTADNMEIRLCHIIQSIEEIIIGFSPGEIAIEETFVNKNPMLSLKLGYAKGVAMAAAGKHKIKLAEYAPKLVKKSLVGVGSASKEQIHFITKQLLPTSNAKNDHESDAIAIAICHIHMRNSKCQLYVK